jgi:cytochrome c oxidase subunit 3
MSEAQLLVDDIHEPVHAAYETNLDPGAEHGGEPHDFELPPSTIAPLIVGGGVALVMIGLIQPLLLVVGLPLALVGVLRMARFPEVDMHARWLQQLNMRKLGMWAFLASEVMFFGALIGALIGFKLNHSAVFDEAHKILSLPLATVGTSVLIISSFAVVMALEAIQSDDRRVFFNWMGLVLLFGVMFLSIQAVEWYELMHEGIEADEIFGTTFFVTTGFHGLHVLGGVGWLALLLQRARNGEYSSRNFLGVELFGLYWHFVDVVWIVLFTVIYLIE